MTIAMSMTTKTEAGPLSGPAFGPVCDALTAILADGIDIHRCQAARALGRIAGSSAIKPLTAALLDEDSDVRTDAATALVELADEEAGDQLFENLLGDPTSEVKLAAIDALTRLGHADLVPWLRRMVRGRDEEIVWDEDEFYATGWDDWADIQARAVSALGKLGATEAVPDIVAALDGEDAQDLTAFAFRALSGLGPEGIGALEEFVGAATSRTRRRAVTTLSLIDDDRARAAVVRALEDSEPDVRIAALKGCAKAATHDPRIALMLDDPDGAVRAQAVELIGAEHSHELTSLLNDSDERVVLAVLDHFANGVTVPDVEALRAALADRIETSDDKIAAASCTALNAIADEESRELLRTIAGDISRPVPVRKAALAVFAGGSEPEDTKALARLIDDDARPVRLEVMSLLGRRSIAGARWPNPDGEALLAALGGAHDPEPEPAPDDDAETDGETDSGGPVEGGAPGVDAQAEDVPAQGIDGAAEPDLTPTSTLDAMLGEAPGIAETVGLPEHGEDLSAEDMERLAIARNVLRKKRVSLEPKLIKHQDIRQFAARVLGDVAIHDSLAALSQALSSEDSDLRACAADSLARVAMKLGDLPAPISARARACFDAGGRDLKLPLIRALSMSSDDDIIEFLENLLKNEDSFVRAEAVRALERKHHVCAIVRALLDDPDSAVRFAVAEAIAEARKPEAVDQLVAFSFSHEGYHAKQTARLLREIDAIGASHAFVKVLGDPDQKRVWPVAIQALEEINRP